MAKEGCSSFTIRVGCGTDLRIVPDDLTVFMWLARPGHKVGPQVRCDDARASIEFIAKLLAGHPALVYNLYENSYKSVTGELRDAWEGLVDACLMSSASTVRLSDLAAHIESQSQYDAELRWLHGYKGAFFGRTPSAAYDADVLGEATKPPRRSFGALRRGAAPDVPRPPPLIVCLNPDECPCLLNEL